MANTTSPLLPSTEDLLAGFGERLRLARLRRRLQAKQVAERAGMTEVTLRRVERGLPGVTMGAYLAVMQVLQLHPEVEKWATDDPLGRHLQDSQVEGGMRPRRAKRVLVRKLSPLTTSLGQVGVTVPAPASGQRTVLVERAGADGRREQGVRAGDLVKVLKRTAGSRQGAVSTSTPAAPPSDAPPSAVGPSTLSAPSPPSSGGEGAGSRGVSAADLRALLKRPRKSDPKNL